MPMQYGGLTLAQIDQGSVECVVMADRQSSEVVLIPKKPGIGRTVGLLENQEEIIEVLNRSCVGSSPEARVARRILESISKSELHFSFPPI